MWDTFLEKVKNMIWKENFQKLKPSYRSSTWILSVDKREAVNRDLRVEDALRENGSLFKMLAVMEGWPIEEFEIYAQSNNLLEKDHAGKYFKVSIATGQTKSPNYLKQMHEEVKTYGRKNFIGIGTENCSVFSSIIFGEDIDEGQFEVKEQTNREQINGVIDKEAITTKVLYYFSDSKKLILIPNFNLLENNVADKENKIRWVGETIKELLEIHAELFKNHDLYIPPNEPFKNDLFSRKEGVESLSAIIAEMQEPTVLCVDASWGQGKTTFLKMLQSYMHEKEKMNAIYFNAWENDFSEDAVTCLLGEIETYLENYISGDKYTKGDEIFEGVLYDFKNSAINLIRATAKSVSRMIPYDPIPPELIDEVGKKRELTGIQKQIYSEISNYRNTKKSLQIFKKYLSELSYRLSVRRILDAKNNEESIKPLVFIIDELDRCRPTFAIEVLEKAKHLFNAENVVFILGLDKTQLGKAIKTVYGHEMDVDGYLHRFIDFTYLLPEPTTEVFVKGLFNKLIKQHFLRRKEKGFGGVDEDYSYFETMVLALIDLYQPVSLREIERCCWILNLALRLSKINEGLYPHLLSYLIVLKIKDTETYQQILNKSIECTALYEKIKKRKGGDNFLKTAGGRILLGYLEIFLSNYGISAAALVKRMEKQYSLEKQNYSLALAKEHFKVEESYIKRGVLEKQIQKVEMIGQLKQE